MAAPIDRTEHSKNRTLPDLKRLAGAAFVACLPFVGLALALGYRRSAIGIGAGYLICLAMYALLRTMVTRGMDAIGAGLTGSDRVSGQGAAKAQFAVVAFGKFILLAILLWLALGVIKVNLLGFGVGFVASQAAITLLAVSELKKTPTE